MKVSGDGPRPHSARRTSSAPTSRSTAARSSTATSTRPSTRSPRRNTWKYEKVNGQVLPNRKFGGGNPRKMELSLLFDQTLPDAYTMTVARGHRRAAGRDGGAERPAAGTPTAAPPFMTFGWGTLDLQGRAARASPSPTSSSAPTGEPIRADVKLSLKQTGRAAQGPEPDHARAGRLRRAPRQGRRHAALDLLPRLRGRHALAADRGGQRRRQPAAPAPRQLARRCRRWRTDASRQHRPSSTSQSARHPGRRRGARPASGATR